MTFDPPNRKTSATPFPEINVNAGALSLEEWESPVAKKAAPAPAASAASTTHAAPPPPQSQSPTPPSQQELTGHDIAYLNPKEFRNGHLGLEFYAPGSWNEVKNSRSLHLLDAATGTKLEANGFAREGISIEKWVGMRLHIVEKEMPHFKQVAKPIVIKGENWGNRIQGIVAEYKGIQPGDTEESHLLICCMRTDSMLVSIAITAKASVFTIKRPVYNWIFSRSDMVMPVAAGSASAKSNAAASAGNGAARSTTMADSVSSVQYASADGHDVGRLAIGQRLLILGIVFYFVLAAWVNKMDFSSRVEILGLCCLGLMTIFCSLLGFFRMAGGFGWSAVKTLFMFILSFIPLVNIILMVTYNVKATDRIKQDGYKVGFLGAREAIPDDNHDLRNIFLVSLALTACLFAVSGKIIKPPKEDPVAEFSPPDNRYSISMPGTPIEQEAPAAEGVFNNHTYSVTSGKIQYAITSFDLAVRPADPTYFLDTIKAGMVGQGKNKISVINENSIQVEGNAGRSVTLSAPGAVKKVDFFLVGKTVYIIEAGAPKEMADSPKIAAFFESFHTN
ncbi:hypothetical protein ACO0LL_28875 [Undibacterium sp. TC4M20W]|uniref:hypothetical protein n=1 Tax=Undibacterium sp. TC4M20W TaxID=3413052 RepID=UPI003BF014B5